MLPANRPSRDAPGLVNRVRVQQQHPAVRISFGQGLEIGWFVIDECEDMITLVLKVP